MENNSCFCWVYLCLVWLTLCSVIGETLSQGIHISEKICGQKYCKPEEFCSNIDRTCQSCANFCDKSNKHKFDPAICEKECQNYLHDQRYVTKNENGTPQDEDLRVVVQKLSRLLTVTLTLVCLILVVLGSLLCFRLYRWKQKENVTLKNIRTKFFSKKSDATANNNKSANSTPSQQVNPRHDLHLDIPNSETHSENSPVTVTTSISRRPAEDTLEYAYDNPAMARSTNGSTKAHERTF